MMVKFKGVSELHIVNYTTWENGSDAEKHCVANARKEWTKKGSMSGVVAMGAGAVTRSGQRYTGGTLRGLCEPRTSNGRPSFQSDDSNCAPYSGMNLYPDRFGDAVVREAIIRDCCDKHGQAKNLMSIKVPFERAGTRLVFTNLKLPRATIADETANLDWFLSQDAKSQLVGGFALQLTDGPDSRHCISLRAVLGRATEVIDCARPEILPFTRLTMNKYTGVKFAYRVTALEPKKKKKKKKHKKRKESFKNGPSGKNRRTSE
jgi:hypothetical protein